ncbi:antibiotic biosynthesis monooxygenase [Rhodospirillaceae bacterium SYSU D60014]|uniref:antibiotic biosynthesis monooxygenase n=1 Tax=Virgifigura deserti TaxID=2268457 RepID=UPI000E66F918
MTGGIVIALYRPKPGQSGELESILAHHVPSLRREGLATSRPVLLLRSTVDGSYLEIFEWIDPEAAERAHTNEHVRAIWASITEVADVLRLADLAEAEDRFPHFEAVEELVI